MDRFWVGVLVRINLLMNVMIAGIMVAVASVSDVSMTTSATVGAIQGLGWLATLWAWAVYG